MTVQDVDASISFYRDKLGFVSDFTLQDGNGKTFLGSVEVGDIVIMFQSADPKEPAMENRGARSGINLTICFSETHDLDTLCGEIGSEGATLGTDPGAIGTSRSLTLTVTN